MKTLHQELAKALAAVIMLLTTSTVSFAQYQQRSYDLKCGAVSGTDFGRSIINRFDKGYAISGFTYINNCGIGPFDWMFVKVFNSGIHESARIIGTQGDDKCYSLIQVPNDSGYVLAGDMYQNNGTRAATLVRLTKSSALSMSRRIDDTVNSQYFQVILDSSRRWAFTGMNERPYWGKRIPKLLVTQYASTGVMNWGYRYDSYINANVLSKSKEVGVSLCYQKFGVQGYGVAVRTNRFGGSNGTDIMIVKLNNSGSVLWNRVYRINITGNVYPSAEPSKIIAMSDGGFTVVGTTTAYGQQKDIIVIRVDVAGNVIWSNTFGTTSAAETGQSIVQDGANFVVAGSRQGSGGATPNSLLMKIPTGGGVPLWTKIWDAGNPGAEFAYDLVNSTQSATTGYAITGETNRAANLYDPFLWRPDANGLITGMNCQDSVQLQVYTNPHKIETLLLKREIVKDCPMNPTIVTPSVVTSTFCLSTAHSPEGTPELDNGSIDELSYVLNQNYPNPFNPTTKIQYSIPFAGNVTIKVFDTNGKEVMTLFDGQRSEGRYEVEFNGANLSTGIYYYKLTAGNFTDVKKMMLIK